MTEAITDRRWRGYKYPYCPILLVRMCHFSLSSCLSSFPVMIPILSDISLVLSLLSFFFQCAIYSLINTCIPPFYANVSSPSHHLRGMSLTEIYKHLLFMKMV